MLPLCWLRATGTGADEELPPGQIEAERLGFSGALDDDENPGAGTAAQAVLDDIGEVASLGRFAVDMGKYIADSDPRKVGGAAGDQLAHDDLAVRLRDAVDAHAAELPRRVRRMTVEQREQGQDACQE